MKSKYQSTCRITLLGAGVGKLGAPQLLTLGELEVGDDRLGGALALEYRQVAAPEIERGELRNVWLDHHIRFRQLGGRDRIAHDSESLQQYVDGVAQRFLARPRRDVDGDDDVGA